MNSAKALYLLGGLLLWTFCGQGWADVGKGEGKRVIEVIYTEAALRHAQADYRHVPRGFVARYHDLDEPQRLQQQRQRDLAQAKHYQMRPERADPDSVKRRFSAWLASPAGKAYIDARQRSAQGLSLVMTHGLSKLPAVVIDGEYVFYGVRNLESAVNALARLSRDDRHDS